MWNYKKRSKEVEYIKVVWLHVPSLSKIKVFIFKTSFSDFQKSSFFIWRFVYYILINMWFLWILIILFFPKYVRVFSPLAKDTSCSFQGQRKQSDFADVSLLMGTETCYVTSALFCMEKSVAEIFQVIELGQIQAVCLLLFFSKNISYLALVKDLLLHGQWGHILYPHVLRAQLFRGRVSQKSVCHGCLRLGWYEESCLG